VTHAAGLGEHLPAQFLIVIERIVRLLRESGLRPRCQQKHENRGVARHPGILPTSIFLEILLSRAGKRKAPSQVGAACPPCVRRDPPALGRRRQRKLLVPNPHLSFCRLSSSRSGERAPAVRWLETALSPALESGARHHRSAGVGRPLAETGTRDRGMDDKALDELCEWHDEQ